MFSRKTYKGAWCAGLLSATVCISAFATDRIVPTNYSTIQKAYNAAVNGDKIRIKTDQSVTGFYISKTVSIENYYSSGTVKISLSSITPLTIDANDVIFTNLKIAGYNTSGTLVRVNANKSGFVMNYCTIQGPGQYAVRDWGSVTTGFNTCHILNTKWGIYGDNMQRCFLFAGDVNNSYQNIHSVRSGGSTVNIYCYFLSPILTAGTSNYASCIYSNNPDPNHSAMYDWETGSMAAYGTGARCLWFDGYYSLNGGSATHVHCPEDGK
jgi:hypothetical protein